MDRNDSMVPLDDEDGTGFWDTQPAFTPLQPWQRPDPAVTQGSLGAATPALWWARLLFWGVLAVVLVSLCWLLVLALEPVPQHRAALWAAAPLLRLELLQSSGALQGWRPATWWETLWGWLVQGSPLERRADEGGL